MGERMRCRIEYKYCLDSNNGEIIGTEHGIECERHIGAGKCVLAAYVNEQEQLLACAHIRSAHNGTHRIGKHRTSERPRSQRHIFLFIRPIDVVCR